MRREWCDAKRIVIKIGSNLLVDGAKAALKEVWLQSLVEDICRLQQDGKDVLLVSSGAVALGRKEIGMADGTLKLNEAQAAAAVGQISLAHAYQNLFSQFDVRSGQILLTLSDTEERRRYLNARSTMTTLLKHKIVPIVNENDSVATNEIRYGDNDRLAARVASMVGADCLLIFSDIDGLYTKPPASNSDATHIEVIEEINDDIFAMAGGAASELSRGGMMTKIKAAEIATEAGCHMIIAHGGVTHPIKAFENGAKASWFLASENPTAARIKWIGGALQPNGIITIDEGAAKALREGNSLLPAGVTDVAGEFERGDAVIIITEDQIELGRGLTAYGVKDAQKIMGSQSQDIVDILGYTGRTALIHRDDMALLNEPHKLTLDNET